jgi:hypothetical protein
VDDLLALGYRTDRVDDEGKRLRVEAVDDVGRAAGDGMK